VECLSGIPGLVGGSPVQNIGAYGQEVSETIVSVLVYDRAERRIRDLSREECGFAYRHSIFNTTARDRYIVLAVAFRLIPGGAPSLRYGDIQKYFAEEREQPSLATVREGVLTRMKHRIVSTATPARIGARLGLGNHLRMSRGEEKTGGREKPAILANTLEAIIAAVFFDSGYAEARNFVTTLFDEEIKAATPRASLDYKTLLQETLQAAKLSAPVYSLVQTDGPAHERTFHVTAKWESGETNGVGSSIKAAEMMAASEALKAIDRENGSSGKQNGH
jgi:dsRNA-specific ribonuclease